MLVIIENEYEGSDFEEILNFDYQKTAEARFPCPFRLFMSLRCRGKYSADRSF